MTKVKICGLTESQQVVAAAQAGADFIGFVLAPSQRQVSIEKTRRMVEVARGLKNRPATVGVFVNATANEVNRIANYCSLDWVQLSGDETWQDCQHIERPVIKAIHIALGSVCHDSKNLLAQVTAGYRLLTRQKLICLVDSKGAGKYGGTGQSFDWEIVRQAAARFPVIVAGGLTPATVNTLVEEIQPWGVDVSTGVESNGQKDEAKIRAFIAAVRKAEQTVARQMGNLREAKQTT